MRKTYSAGQIQNLRRRVFQLTEIQRNRQQGWSKSLVDPMALLGLFRPLHLRSGYVLCAYEYVSGDDGNGVVYVIPDNIPVPDPQECETAPRAFLHPPVPGGSDRKIMHYIEGPTTPRSYLLASVLARELLEFGARRHGCLWSLEQIIGSDPETGTWEWHESPPHDWRPVVDVSATEVTVTFHTYTETAPEHVTRYTDRYARGSYSFTTERVILAIRRAF